MGLASALRWINKRPHTCIADCRGYHRSMPDITQLLEAAAAGDRHAAADLLPQVYNELRKLAAACMATEKPGQTLQATALVHEAYMRLVHPLAPDESPGANGQFANRAQFFAAAAEAMRRILVENARRKGRLKRGGDRQRIDLDALPAPDGADPDELLAVDEALTALAADDPLAAELVKMRYFAGFTIEEAGELLGLSRSTAYERWAYGRAWLRCKLADESNEKAGY
jgi:RNA polymerase sigma factor (TIGR02999 family)